MTSEQLYAEIILDYYRNPRNFGTLEDSDVIFRDVNPVCGDITEMHLKIDRGKIVDIKYSGKGCAISVAASGMLTEYVKGKTLDEARAVKREDVLAMLGIPISMVRMKCALLGLKVFKYSIYKYLGMNVDERGLEDNGYYEGKSY